MKYDPADPSHFLNSLPIGEDERSRLGALSPDSAFDLLSRRRAAKAAFDAHLGPARADAVARVLEAALAPDERAALNAPLVRHRRGARPDKP